MCNMTADNRVENCYQQEIKHPALRYDKFHWKNVDKQQDSSTI